MKWSESYEKRISTMISSVLCSVIVLSSAVSSTEGEIASSDFDSELNSIFLEYSQKYSQYTERIGIKVDAYRYHDSYREYYEENPSDAVENVRASLDYYIEYCQSNESGAVLGATQGVASPLAVDGNQF